MNNLKLYEVIYSPRPRVVVRVYAKDARQAMEMGDKIEPDLSKVNFIVDDARQICETRSDPEWYERAVNCIIEYLDEQHEKKGKE